jgi:putative ABC transport system permease protein
MVPTEVIKTGVRNLLTHRLRSALSVLGVVFGVAAVIAMLSIGEGARREALEQIRLMGTHNILVRALALDSQRQVEAEHNLSQGLTLGDAFRVQAILPQVDSVTALKESDAVARLRDRETDAHLVETIPTYLAVAGLSLTQGRFFRAEDLEDNRRVCILGWNVRQRLFPHGENPLDGVVSIDGQLYPVIGVLENRDVPTGTNQAVQVRDVNNDIYVPLLAGTLALASEVRVDEVVIRVKDAGEVVTVSRLARSVLARIHHEVSDFEIIVPQELLNQSQRTQRIFNIVMGSIAGISLLVGGIGIMNIMLATVTERTKEIGIRRALGASRWDVLKQFLAETSVLTVTGGMIGVIFGAAASRLIHTQVGWRTVVAVDAVLVAFFVSVLAGIIFGMYPAYKAAHMNPIDALRYE